ncbi:MAG TPA: hypothetical protein VFI00_16220 [Kribbella sp.]|nr:hypothetical protein [Kribbella sp.]
MARWLAVLVGTTGLVLGLSSCATADQPSGQETSQPPSTSQVGSPDQELNGIGSTLDAIDGELAADGSP